MNIKLKDGSFIEVKENAVALDVAKAIGAGLTKSALAAEVNGEAVDLRTPVKDGDSVSILTFDDAYGKKAFRHSTAHLMAQAIQHLYPNTEFAIGPAIEDGYYYDMELEKPISEENFAAIEEEMKKIVKEDLPIERFTMSRKEALNYFKERNQKYKIELIEDLPEDSELSFYRQGDFTDLCAGPHVQSTGQLKAFHLNSVAGAYWRGDEHNKMLTRLYGTSFPKKSMLDEHLTRIEEAKKRDHRKVGKDMEIFALMEEGPGFPFFLPNGMVIKNELMNYWREIHKKAGYDEISTPQILKRQLWETSGHWDHYRENMYTTKIDDEDYAIKPMNCPGGVLVYNSKPRSYRDLPLRLAEVGVVHRHELSGALHGLFRVRCFSQDDAHIFMTPEQITQEIKGVVKIIDDVYTKFGFTYHIELSTRPEDSMGTDEEWEVATEGLRKALDELGKEYVVNEGDGAFYGPKIDFHIEDVLKRTWQCGTIQLDFQLPQRFEAEYIGADGEKHRPIMIHRVVYGSIERFIGILIEQFAGNFPIWLAPRQVELIPVSNKAHGEKCHEMADELKALGVRADVDDREETLNKKIRDAQTQKVSIQLVIGDREVENNTVSIRRVGGEKQVQMSWTEFKTWLEEQIDTRA